MIKRKIRIHLHVPAVENDEGRTQIVTGRVNPKTPAYVKAEQTETVTAPTVTRWAPTTPNLGAPAPDGYMVHARASAYTECRHCKFWSGRTARDDTWVGFCLKPNGPHYGHRCGQHALATVDCGFELNEVPTS